MRTETEHGKCDLCDGPYLLGGDDHNGETGNHFHCEQQQTDGPCPECVIDREPVDSGTPWQWICCDRCDWGNR